MSAKLIVSMLFFSSVAFFVGPCQTSEQSEEKHESDNIVSPATQNNEQSPNIYKIWSLGAEPDAIPLASRACVVFSVRVSGGEKAPEELELFELKKGKEKQQKVGYLKDDGENGDLIRGDRIYSGRFELFGEEEGIRFFQAQFTHDNVEYHSPVYKWTVTEFPIGSAPPDQEMLIADPETGQTFYANELILSFVENTTSERIVEIITTEKCYIAGTIPSLGAFQVRFETEGTLEEYHLIKQKLEQYQEVRSIGPNYVIDIH